MSTTPISPIFTLSGTPLRQQGPSLIPFPSHAVGPNSNRNPALHTEDETRWLGISEASITLGDGILHSIGLLGHPYGKSGKELTTGDTSLMEFDIENLLKSGDEDGNKSIQNLDQRLTQLCTGSIVELRSYQHHLFTLFRAMWIRKNKFALKSERSITASVPKGQTKEPGEKGLTSRFSLTLLVPLLKSQSCMDANLAATTAQLLLEMLAELEPMSLSKEFQKPLDQLEDLLSHWISESCSNNESQLKSIVGPSAMIGLACARGSLFSFLRTIQLLQSLDLESKLPVTKFLKSLPSTSLRIGKCCSILGENHLRTFPCNNRIILPVPSDVTPSQGSQSPNVHCLATDGTFLYVSGAKGKGLSKIGSGYNGSIRGFVYSVNSQISVTHLAFGNNILVSNYSRPSPLASKSNIKDNIVPWGSIIDCQTLERKAIIFTSSDEGFYNKHKSVALASDGKFFYKLFVAFPMSVSINPPTPSTADLTEQVELTEKETSSPPAINVFLEIMEIVSSDDNLTFTAVLVRDRILLEFASMNFLTVPSDTDLSKMRAVRVATTTAQVISNALNNAYAATASDVPTTPENMDLEKPTTLGFKLRELHKATMLTCGTFVNIVIDYSSIKPQTQIHSGFFPPVIPNSHSVSARKANAVQIEVLLSGSSPSPTYTIKKLDDLPSHCSFFKDVTINVSHIGITYDPKNHLIWTAGGDYIDTWKCGKTLSPVWMQKAHLMLNDNRIINYDEEDMKIADVLNSLWTHIGLIAENITDSNNANEMVELIQKMMSNNVNNLEATALISILRAFQTVLRNSNPLSKLNKEMLYASYFQVVEIIRNPVLMLKFPFHDDFGVYFEAAKVLAILFDIIYTDKKERDNAINDVLFWSDEIEEEPGFSDREKLVKLLKSTFLKQWTEKLSYNDGVRYDDIKSLIFSPFILTKFIEEAIQGAVVGFDLLSELFEGGNFAVQSVPIKCDSTEYIIACVNCFLKSWILNAKSGVSKQMRCECLSLFKSVLNHSSTIVDRCIEFLVSYETTNHLAALISAENILKSSFVGLGIPQLLIWLSEESVKDQTVAEELAEENIQFFVALSHLNDKISIRADEFVADDWTTIIPKPISFHNHRYFESQHPIKENTKFKETVVFNGANKLYIKFDPRSSTQYDYDKLILSAGAGNQAKRIGEFGGNFYGFGNRLNSVPPWPRDFITVEGDTLTYSFEVRSGKEPNTPDYVVWGYGFTVFPDYEQYSTSPINAALEFRMRTQTTHVGNTLRESYFLDQLAMVSLDSISCITRTLISGEPRSPLEDEINHVLNSDLLNNFRWNRHTSSRNFDPLPCSDTISSAKIEDMRKKAKVMGLPPMRKRMIEIVRPEEIEKLYVLVCMKYLETELDNDEPRASTSRAVSIPSKRSYTDYPEVLHKIFYDIDCLIRKLASVTELQLKFIEEVNDILTNGKKLDEIILTNMYHGKNMESELENVALICDLTFDKMNPTSVIPDAISIIQAFVDAGSSPELTKAQELVEETIGKLRQLLSFEKNQDEKFWSCLDIAQAKRRAQQVYNYVYSHFINWNSTINNICEVVEKHKARAVSRSQGLQLILKVLECSKHTSQSLVVASSLLRESTKVEDITCSGLEKEIKELIGQCMGSIVDVALENPLRYRNAVTLLCTLQYKPGDERLIIESKLLEVLDTLCANQMQLVDPAQSLDKALLKNSASLAWASFQILAHRCSSWDSRATSNEVEEDTGKIALPVKISANITNHLARAATLTLASASQTDSESLSTKGFSLSETVDDVLCLLDKLRDTKLGRAILMQNPCVCQLLALLLDPRLSPRLVLLIIRLLTIALPLVKNLELKDLSVLNIHLIKKKTSSPPQELNPYNVVANLLLSKLADYLVVGNQYNSLLKNSFSKQNEAMTKRKFKIWLIKPPGKPASSILQTLFDPKNKELLPTLPITRAEIEELLNSIGKVAIGIDDINIAQAKIEKYANIGIQVLLTQAETILPEINDENKPNENPSIPPRVPPVSILGQSGSRNAGTTTSTKANLIEQLCKDKNVYLQKNDPLRTFLSGDVAEDLASELIQLLQHLLSPNSTGTLEESKIITSKGSISLMLSNTTLKSADAEYQSGKTFWISAVEQAVSASLKPLTKLCNVGNIASTPLESYGLSARIAIAALSVLGSFTEKVREGSTVYILNGDETFSNDEQVYDDWEFISNKGKVISIDPFTEISIVKIIADAKEEILLVPSPHLYVPLNRLIPTRITQLPELSPSCMKNIASVLTNLLLPPNSGTTKQTDALSPMKKQFPSINQIVEKSGNASHSISTTPAPLESKTIANSMTIVRLAAEIKTRSAHILSIWMKKPEFVREFLGIGSETNIPNTSNINRDSIIAVNTLKTLAKECRASHKTHDVEKSITRLRLLYRDCTKPPKISTTTNQEVNELEGEGSIDDSGHRLQRVSDSLHDLNFSLFYPYLREIDSDSEFSFEEAETGSEDDGSIDLDLPSPRHSNINHVVIQVNEEEPVNEVGEDSDVSIDSEDDDVMEILPFIHVEQEESALDQGTTGEQSQSSEQTTCNRITKDCHIAKPKSDITEYLFTNTLEYYLSPSYTYNIRVFTGPNRYVCSCSNKLKSEMDFLANDDELLEDPTSSTNFPSSSRRTYSRMVDNGSEDAQELLVRAWETKVFPIIRRRFRNETERRDGLDQIRGALNMGMTDIARQTVEFLYEENGGIPRDLHLPTLEEIRIELSRFTVERIKVGMAVMIRGLKTEDNAASNGIVNANQFSVGPMLKTFGLIGEVLNIDHANELILVDTYVESEGCLMRFWYPIKCLEKLSVPKKTAVNSHNIDMLKLHSHLVSLELSLSRLYCREAFLQILNACNHGYGENFLSGDTALSFSKSTANLFKELDTENLEIRSQSSFANFRLNGDLLTYNLLYNNPSMNYLTDMGNPSVIFYDNYGNLSLELKAIIEKAYENEEESLIKLTKQMCSVLEFPQDKFVFEEVPLDKEENVEIVLPNSAFALVSVRGPVLKKPGAPTSVTFKEPCVHIYAMNSGEKKYPLVCYPLQTLSSLQKQNTRPPSGNNNATLSILQLRRKNLFPTVLAPTDKLSCVVTQTSLSGHTLEVTGIPSQFPLSLLFCQQLIKFQQSKQAGHEYLSITLLTILLSFLQKTQLPPTIKEWIFTLLSEIINSTGSTPLVQEFYLTQTLTFNRLFQELVTLYEYEVKPKTFINSLQALTPFIGNIGTSALPVPIPGPSRNPPRSPKTGVFVEVGRILNDAFNRKCSNSRTDSQSQSRASVPILSFYLQSLIELCLSISKALEPLMNSPNPSPSTSKEKQTPVPTNAPIAPIPEGTQPGNGPQENQGQWKEVPQRKMLRAIRNPLNVKIERRKNKSETSNTKIEELTVKSCTEISWFRQILYASKIVSIFTQRDNLLQENIQFAGQIVRECNEYMKTKIAPDRLIIITGIANEKNITLEAAITRAMKDVGGIFANQLWSSQERSEAVFEVRSASKVDFALDLLKRKETWNPLENLAANPEVNIHRVNNNLETGDSHADKILKMFLNGKVFGFETNGEFSEKCVNVLTNIFTSCYVYNVNEVHDEIAEPDDYGTILLNKNHLTNNQSGGNLMAKFISCLTPINMDSSQFAYVILNKYGQKPRGPLSNDAKKNDAFESDAVGSFVAVTGTKNAGIDALSTGLKDDTLGLTETGFLDWCKQYAGDDINSFWKALLEVGIDFQLDRIWCPCSNLLTDATVGKNWTREQDGALVWYMNHLGQTLHISPMYIHPHDIYLDENMVLNPKLSPLKGLPIEFVRMRCCILQLINGLTSHSLLPFVPLHTSRCMRKSFASQMYDLRNLLFYHIKDEFLYKVLQHSAIRGVDVVPPEVTLDPIKNIGKEVTDPKSTFFSQTICQLSQVPSSVLCVQPSAGSDPPLPVIFKFLGEEVHGQIGSFRHFISSVVEEIQTSPLNLMIPCPSSAAGNNKDAYLIKPGSLTVGEERLLQSIGQLLGVCIRTDSPTSIDFLGSVWKSLLNYSAKPNEDSDEELKEADILSFNFIKAFELDVGEVPFKQILEEYDYPTFQYLSIDAKTVVPLCPGGGNLNVNYGNREQFCRLLKRLREKEMRSSNRVNMILSGLSSLVPIPLILNLFTPFDLEMRISGSPEINLALLKSHTHYQAGVSKTDRHIIYFWSALESMSPEELKNFIKFASNQERLPITCPCQNSILSSSNQNVAHVPPFPMIIAPIDIPLSASPEYINNRTIRVETCMFLIRLPPYTTYQATRNQLLFASNSRDDPLSG